MKIYVIGAGQMTDAELIAKAALSADTEIVRINSREDIPLEDMLKSNCRNSVVEIQKLNIIPRPIDYEQYFKPKYKGYERPYKYHK